MKKLKAGRTDGFDGGVKVYNMLGGNACGGCLVRKFYLYSNFRKVQELEGNMHGTTVLILIQVRQPLLSAVRRNREAAKSKSVYADLLEARQGTAKGGNPYDNILDIRLVASLSVTRLPMQCVKLI